MQRMSAWMSNVLAAFMLLMGVAVLATSVRADVTIEQKTKTAAIGGFLNSEMKTETMISGDMQCENSEIKMKKMLGMFGGGEPMRTSTITRLDKGVVWEVMHAQSMYTEQKISDMKEMMSGLSDAFGESEEDDDEGMGFGSEDVEWGPPKFSIDHTGKTEKIAGYECKQSIVKMDMEGTHIETGEKVKMHLTLDMFLSESIEGLGEYQEFSRKRAEAMGLEADDAGSMAYGMLEALKMYGVESEEIAAEAGKLEGYPMRLTMELRGEGGEFANMQSQMSDEDQEKMKDAKKTLGKLGGLFGGGKDDEDEEAEDEADDGDLKDALFRVETEVTKVSTSSVKSGVFDPPANYEKIGGDD